MTVEKVEAEHGGELGTGGLDDKGDQLFLVINTKRNILRAILNPERVKTWDSVRPAIEQLDDLMRRYEARRNEQGNRETLSEDIKCTSLELLVPTRATPDPEQKQIDHLEARANS